MKANALKLSPTLAVGCTSEQLNRLELALNMHNSGGNRQTSHFQLSNTLINGTVATAYSIMKPSFVVVM
jgi:hypothetical protein